MVTKSEIPDYIDGADWIELYNSGNAPVNLSAYQLRDSGDEPAPLPNTELQPGDYIIIAAADEPPTDGTPFVPFKLGSEDSLTLMHNQQDVDALVWLDGEAKQGRSFGRLNGVEQTLYPSPLEANVPYVLFDKYQVMRVDITLTPSDWNMLLATAADEQYFPADFNLNGAKLAEVAVRTKGQSSLSMVDQIPDNDHTAHRYGFKVDFNYYKDQKFMGMKKLVFNNSFADPSLMRDVVAYQLFKDAGMPSPEASYVDLWIGGEHLGIYQMVEAIDGEFVEKYFPDDKAADLKGDLYKVEVFNYLDWQGTDPAAYEGIRLKTNEETLGTPDESLALITFLNTLNNGSNPLEHVDTELMTRYLAGLVLTSNMDSYIGGTANNYYLYHHVTRDAFTMLPWDFNLGYGTFGSFGGFGGFGGGGASCDVTEHVIENPVADANPRPLVDAVLNDPTLMADYKQHLRDLITGPYQADKVKAEILRIADMLDPYMQNDPTFFFTYNEWKQSLTEDLPENSSTSGGRGGGFFGPAPGLIPFIEQRNDNILRQLNGEIPANNGNADNACPS